jgi:uncharacterized protein (DUF58 family)
MTTTHGIRPELAELIALRQRVLAWPPPQRASGSQAGPAFSPLRGRGMDYAESRLYAHGDDARHIDWRVTARTGRTHTKIFHAERDRVTLLLADTAPQLYFGTRVCFKSVLAARVGALAAWAAQRSGDRIAALRGSRSDAPIAPAGGARGVLRVLDALVRWYAQPPLEDAGFGHALETVARVAKQGARLIALLDPRSVDSISDARFSALAAHHDAIAVLLVDPLELSPPNAQLAFALDQGRISLDLRQRSSRNAWSHEFAEHHLATRERLQRLGWRTLQQSTDQPPEQILGAILSARREAA